jgi:serine/threonine protein kinase
MSPEQASGETAKVDERSDVHALGAILYFLLCGEPPFEAESPAEARRLAALGRATPLRRRDPSIPRALESIGARAMSRDPAKRYDTAEEMAADVERFLDGLPVLAHRETLLEKGARLARRHQALLLLVLAYLLARVLILVLAGR